MPRRVMMRMARDTVDWWSIACGAHIGGGIKSKKMLTSRRQGTYIPVLAFRSESQVGGSSTSGGATVVQGCSKESLTDILSD